MSRRFSSSEIRKAVCNSVARCRRAPNSSLSNCSGVILVAGCGRLAVWEVRRSRNGGDGLIMVSGLLGGDKTVVVASPRCKSTGEVRRMLLPVLVKWTPLPVDDESGSRNRLVLVDEEELG